MPRVKKQIVIEYTLFVDERQVATPEGRMDIKEDIFAALKHCYYNDRTPASVTIANPGEVKLKKKQPWEIATRRINIEAIFQDMLADLGLDREGNQLGSIRSPFLYEVKDISYNQARAIKRHVDKAMNPHDRYCELRYDRKKRAALYDIVT